MTPRILCRRLNLWLPGREGGRKALLGSLGWTCTHCCIPWRRERWRPAGVRSRERKPQHPLHTVDANGDVRGEGVWEEEENYSHSGSGPQPRGGDAWRTNGHREITATSLPRRDHVPGPLPQARGRDGDAASGGASLAGTRAAERLRDRSSASAPQGRARGPGVTLRSRAGGAEFLRVCPPAGGAGRRPGLQPSWRRPSPPPPSPLGGPGPATPLTCGDSAPGPRRRPEGRRRPKSLQMVIAAVKLKDVYSS